MMFKLLVTITGLKHLETLDTAVYMLDMDTEFRQAAVKRFLFSGQFTAFGPFVWS